MAQLLLLPMQHGIHDDGPQLREVIFRQLGLCDVNYAILFNVELLCATKGLEEVRAELEQVRAELREVKEQHLRETLRREQEGRHAMGVGDSRDLRDCTDSV